MTGGPRYPGHGHALASALRWPQRIGGPSPALASADRRPRPRAGPSPALASADRRPRPRAGPSGSAAPALRWPQRIGGPSPALASADRRPRPCRAPDQAGPGRTRPDQAGPGRTRLARPRNPREFRVLEVWAGEGGPDKFGGPLGRPHANASRPLTGCGKKDLGLSLVRESRTPPVPATLCAAFV